MCGHPLVVTWLGIAICLGGFWEGCSWQFASPQPVIQADVLKGLVLTDL